MWAPFNEPNRFGKRLVKGLALKKPGAFKGSKRTLCRGDCCPYRFFWALKPFVLILGAQYELSGQGSLLVAFSMIWIDVAARVITPPSNLEASTLYWEALKLRNCQN
jgi:hypothetical protein